MNPESLPWWRRRTAHVCAVVLVVAVVATGVVIRHEGVKDRLAVGVSRSGDFTMTTDGYQSAGADFRLPGARLDVMLEFGQRGFSHVNDTFTDVRAPSGGVLVDLTWSSKADGGQDAPKPSRLLVRSGDTAVVVDEAVTPASATATSTVDKPEKLVALPGRAEDVVVEVQFAGRSQSMNAGSGRRVLGDFAGLYPTPNYSAGPQPVSVAPSPPADARTPFRWSGYASAGQALRMPYVEGLGWAPAGQEWALVRGAGYTLFAPHVGSWTKGSDSARYSVTGKPSVSVTVDGKAPRRVLGAEQVRKSDDLETSSRDYVFAVPMGDSFTVASVVESKAHRTDGTTKAPAITTLHLSDTDTYPAVVDPAPATRETAESSRDRHTDVTVHSNQLDESRASVALPFGALQLTIGVGTKAGLSKHEVTAPPGSSLVEVSWSTGVSGPMDAPPVWPAAAAAQRRDPGAELTLVSDGRRYPLATSVTTADGSSSALVVVRGDGSDARVEARYGGHVELSRPSTTALPRVQTDGREACRDAGNGTYSWVKCNAPVYRGGYVPGLGAAPTGKQWLVVHGASVTRSERWVSVYDADSDGAAYQPSGTPKVEVTAAVAGTAATQVPRLSGSDLAVGDAVRVADRAWLVPTGAEVTVRLDYRLPTVLDRSRPNRPGAPADHLVDVGTTVVCPASPSAA